MIARLKGIVEELGDDWLIVDVSGVGYHVFASSRTLGSMVVGDAVTVVIETHVREDHIHLYGFADTTERDWFKLLTTVQGVGAKVGLGIQSALSPDEISQAIAAQDKATITRAPGVGPKLAARIVSELKDKVGAIALNQTLAASEAMRRKAARQQKAMTCPMLSRHWSIWDIMHHKHWGLYPKPLANWARGPMSLR